MQDHGEQLLAVGRLMTGKARRRANRRGRLLLEHLEQRSLLTIYQPIGVVLAPSPVEGTAFAGAVVGTFTSSSTVGNLSATINWGPTATPTATVGTVNLIGSTFVPGVGNVPQYSVTGGTTYPLWTGSSSQPITVTLSDSSDSSSGIITSSTVVADAPLTTTGGIASASVTEGARVNFSGPIALMTYTDGNPNSTAAEFTASISWGDGSPSSLGTITKSGATYSVSGIHTYPRHTTGTPFTARVSVSDLGGSTATHTTAMTVTDAALSGPTAFPFQAAKGQQFTNMVLGTFLDGNPQGQVSDFTVSIDWGDGTTSDPGFVTLVGGSASNAKFAVSGSHVYTSAAGSPYAVTVSVTDSGGSTTTIDTTATVTQTPLSVTVHTINAVAASPTASQVLATFFDAGGPDLVGSYSATLTWGDGTSDDTAGDLVISAISGQPGMFAIMAPAHTYAAPGFYPIRVTVEHASSFSGSSHGFALVAAASLTAAPSLNGPITGAVEGQALPASTQVGSFTSGDPNAVVSGFSAVVDWGDGTPATIGTITQPGGVGTVFVVTGSHTYAHRNLTGYPITVRVMDAFNNVSVATTQVTTVADAPLTSGTSHPVSAAEHVPLVSIPLATFLDTNPGATAAEYTAIIDWGDGSDLDTNAQIVLVGGGSGAVFAIYGSHTYTMEGSYSIVVNVSSIGGESITITPATANVIVIKSTLSVSVLPQTTHAGMAIPAGTVIGTFNNSFGLTTIGHYSASIDWGDGSPTDALVTISSLGGTSFSVSTDLGHTYNAAGSYAIKLTVVKGTGSGIGGNFVVVDSQAAALPVLTAGSPIVAVEGTLLSGVTVATLSSLPDVTFDSFTASIDWGDGSPASAGIISNGGGPGNFVVTGNHTYREEGEFLVSVALTTSEGKRVSTTLTATVADAPLSGATGIDVTTSQNVPLVNVPLGTFVDGNRWATANDLAATIVWGDGTPSTTGFVTLIGGSASGARFSVAGSHVYASSGTFTVTITVDDLGGSMTMITSQATIRASQVAVSPGIPLAATEGLPTAADQVIATFTNGVNPPPISNFAATIAWGDGSPASSGTIVSNGAGYNVLAPSHTYAQEGTYVINVVITDLANPSLAAPTASFAVVADAPLSAVATPALSGTSGVPLFNVVVGSFLDANPGGTIGDFIATISWGDGTTSLGSISQTGGIGTVFEVRGGHTYGGTFANGASVYPISVVVRDSGGQSLVLTSTATISHGGGSIVAVTAILNPTDDHGVSNSDGVTNDSTPSFLGSSNPGSTIKLFATSATGTILVGQGVTAADGRFTVQVTVPLADGVYMMSVMATDASGLETVSQTLPQPLVIDTVGPKVTNLRFNPLRGRVAATLVDNLSGLDQNALLDGANYRFRTYVPGRPTRSSPYNVTGLSTTVAAQPTDPQTLTILIKRGRALPGGRYLFAISSADGTGSASGNGLRDVAGNALDGEFYGHFASGNNKPGGDFVAGLDTNGRTSYAPVPTQNGYVSPQNSSSVSVSERKTRTVAAHRHTARPAQAKPGGILGLIKKTRSRGQ